MVMFGGASPGGYLNDTWSWDGIEWKEHDARGPSPRYGHRMYYDSESRCVVLTGGMITTPPVFTFSNEVWEYRDGVYRRRHMLADYPQDLVFALIYHAEARRAVMVGIQRSNRSFQVWELRNGVEWIDKPLGAGSGRLRWSGEGLPGTRLVGEQDAGAFDLMLLGNRAAVPAVLNSPIACTKAQLHVDLGWPALLLPWQGNRVALDVPLFPSLIGADLAMHGLAVRKEPCVELSWGISWLVGRP